MWFHIKYVINVTGNSNIRFLFFLFNLISVRQKKVHNAFHFPSFSWYLFSFIFCFIISRKLIKSHYYLWVWVFLFCAPSNDYCVTTLFPTIFPFNSILKHSYSNSIIKNKYKKIHKTLITPQKYVVKNMCVCVCVNFLLFFSGLVSVGFANKYDIIILKHLNMLNVVLVVIFILSINNNNFFF